MPPIQNVKTLLEANHLKSIENFGAKMKDLVLEKQPSSGKALINTIKEVRVREISAQYCTAWSTTSRHRSAY